MYIPFTLQVSKNKENNPQNTSQNQNYFITARNEVRKEQESETELVFAEFKSTAFPPSFPFFFSTTVIFTAPGLI